MTALIGRPLRRKEDGRLLTGKGRFTDDLNLARQAHAVFLRSPHAHARIRAIDTADAAALPGVLAVLTGKDYVAEGLKSLPHNPSGADHFEITKPAFGPETMPGGPPPLQPPLAVERVRFVGEAVALVVATSLDAARDAAERIDVQYEPLAAVIDARAALEGDAPKLWEDRPGNLLVAAENGDRAATEAALARAHRVVRLSCLNQRVSGAPMEPRVAVAEYDEAAESFTIHAVSQGVHRIKFTVAACLGIAMDRVRVITGDVGGGFGVRSSVYPEYAVLAWAARKLGRPVKWNSSRSEAFLADFQARDVWAEGALALDAEGKFLALELSYTGNLGAYPVSYAVLNNVTRMAAGVYDIPAIHVGIKGVATNTVPMSVYRGAGRPESNFIMERLIDLAAAELGIERAELRRRNIIPAASLPYQSPLGHRYDSGAFAENLAAVLRAVDWSGFPARREVARRQGLLRGMLTRSLAAARERGEAVSCLRAAEWQIYGRFGYRPASFAANYRINTGNPLLAVRPGREPVEVRQVEPPGARVLIPQVLDRLRQQQAGHVERPDGMWDQKLGLSQRPGVREPICVVAGNGQVDGYALWIPNDGNWFHEPDQQAQAGVHEVLAATEDAERALWNYLIHIDLVRVLTLTEYPVDLPLEWLLNDGRAVRRTWIGDDHWLRILDLPASLAARRYAVADRLVLEVVDAEGGYAQGRYVLDGCPYHSEGRPTTESADLQLSQRALAGIYLGGSTVRAQSQAGLIEEETPGAAHRLQLMFTTDRAPWNASPF